MPAPICSIIDEAGMTDLQQPDPKSISVKARAITLLAGAVAGSTLGVVAWSLLLATSQATAIVSVGRYDATQFIEEPATVLDRIKLPGFAAAAATRAGIPELSALLPGRQYGGGGALTARSLREPPLIEIKINSAAPEVALKAVTAAVDELIANHEEKAAPLIQHLQSALTEMSQRVSEISRANEEIKKLLSSSSQSEASIHDAANLVSARAFTESSLASLAKRESELRILVFNLRRTQVIAAPTVTMTRAASFYQIVAAGALAGLMAGLLLLQMFPGFSTANAPTRKFPDQTRYEM
jgi:hypothetical protein